MAAVCVRRTSATAAAPTLCSVATADLACAAARSTAASPALLTRLTNGATSNGRMVVGRAVVGRLVVGFCVVGLGCGLITTSSSSSSSSPHMCSPTRSSISSYSRLRWLTLDSSSARSAPSAVASAARRCQTRVVMCDQTPLTTAFMLAMRALSASFSSESALTARRAHSLTSLAKNDSQSKLSSTTRLAAAAAAARRASSALRARSAASSAAFLAAATAARRRRSAFSRARRSASSLSRFCSAISAASSALAAASAAAIASAEQRRVSVMSGAQ